MDYGLMPALVEELRLDCRARSVLLEKLALIHAAILERADREARKKAKHGDW